MTGHETVITAGAEAPRGRGRPRLAQVDDSILGATIEEICTGGLASLTLDRVAARAGVAKTTIYRRWANKTELVIDAIDLLRSKALVADSGDTRADLVAGLDNTMRVFTSPQGRAVAAVLAECRFNAELAAAWQAKIAAPQEAAYAAVFERGLESGQLRFDISVAEARSVVAGVAFQVLLGILPHRPGLAADVVAAVLDGIGAGPGTTRRGSNPC